ncbi:TRAP transporter small permease subunit [Litoreibacter arenae]|uniref:TRAP-type transport system, small permease component, predicted N-acetylneuraminate transporter n=1 Tax=Litoreibacter arenae DSM 19593 TaxID=1123360 RepID=S9QFS7_9RHOB|nr:TRAP transporter small permease subunit [Litoreibacter arenae]EPX80291.1 TRAP-type transport system, small permease component, predicted N-acetylneuraminate transporter [Litoreibacter arenae DSM 19593]
MLDAIVWFFTNIAMSFYNLFYALTHPGQWLSWVPYINQSLPETENKEALMRFIYYGASVELFFVILTTFLVVLAIGFWRNEFMWGCVRVLEGFANTVGRIAAWAGLLMVLQQIVIIFMQRIFAQAEISMGFGMAFSKDISWWAEELKLYNALVVALCVTYTFVQGGHVRVDLVYAKVSYSAKKVIDMVGSLLFMMPVAVLTWLYGWFFLWRHLVVPNPSASDALDKLMLKARALRWNIETIGFSPNGFNAYFLFKILLCLFTAMVFIHAMSFFMRSYLEWKEGPESDGKYLDKDLLGDEDAELAANIH